MNRFKIIKKELSHKGAILDFYTTYVEVPNGNVAKWDCLEHKGAAAIVAVKPNGKLIIEKQYRGAIDEYLYEIPAGGRDSKDEPFEVCAARELEEETGFRTTKLTHLLDYYSAPAYSSEKIVIYYTDELIPSKKHWDADEYIEIMEFSIDELLTMIQTGKITDGKTIAAILAYARL